MTDNKPWPGWPLPDHRPARTGYRKPPDPQPFVRQRRDWLHGTVHPYERIERADLLRAHLAQSHGITDSGLFTQPESIPECFELHRQLHRERPGGWVTP